MLYVSTAAAAAATVLGVGKRETMCCESTFTFCVVLCALAGGWKDNNQPYASRLTGPFSIRAFSYYIYNSRRTGRRIITWEKKREKKHFWTMYIIDLFQVSIHCWHNWLIPRHPPHHIYTHTQCARVCSRSDLKNENTRARLQKSLKQKWTIKWCAPFCGVAHQSFNFHPKHTHTHTHEYATTTQCCGCGNTFPKPNASWTKNIKLEEKIEK